MEKKSFIELSDNSKRGVVVALVFGILGSVVLVDGAFDVFDGIQVISGVALIMACHMIIFILRTEA